MAELADAPDLDIVTSVDRMDKIVDKKRIEWIDLARGIGIILVLVGHTTVQYIPEYFVYAFHMPFFFLLSGICLSVRGDERFTVILSKTIKSIVIPYFFISFIWIVYDSLVCCINGNFSVSFIYEELKIYILQRHYHAIWFLACLFLCKIVSFFIIKYLNESKLIIAVIIAFFFISSYLYSKYSNAYLIWCADLLLTAEPFILIGYLIKVKVIEFNDMKLMKLFSVVFLIICVVSNGINVAVFNNGKKLDFIYNLFGFYPLFLISSLTGSLSLILFSKIYNSCRPLNYIGRNSILFFTLHQIIFLTYDRVYSLFPIKSTAFSICLWVVYIVFSIIIIYIINELIIKTPLCVLIGKNYKKS